MNRDDHVFRMVELANKIIRQMEQPLMYTPQPVSIYGQIPPFVPDENVPPDYMLHTEHQDAGFFFGTTKIYEMNHCVGKPQDRDGHILVVGGPGSHKTSALVIPSFTSWKGHIIALDVKPKGDLLTQCKLKCAETGKRLMVFNPTQEDTAVIDPYEFFRFDGRKKLARNAKALALALLPALPDEKNSIWRKMAQALLAGCIIHYYDLGATFNDTMSAVQKLSVNELMAEIFPELHPDFDPEDMVVDKGNELAQIFVSKLKNLKYETLASIGMDLTELAILAADESVATALSSEKERKKDADVIDWSELNTSTTPCNIILQIPEENLEVWEPMTTLLINQLIRTLERRPDKYSAEGKNLPPILILLDEFDSLGKISAIKSGLSTLRSRGVTFCIVVQSLPQLDDKYGTNTRRVIVDTCAYKAVLSVYDPVSQEYFSKMTGSIIVANKSIGANYNPYGAMVGYNSQATESREPIIHPYQFATHNDIVLITPEGFCRIDKVPYYKIKEEKLCPL